MKIIDNIKYLPINRNEINLWVEGTKQLLIKGRENNVSQIFRNSAFNEERVTNDWINLYS